MSTSQRPDKHGVFYPRGYVIITFGSQAEATKVQQRLFEGGYDADDVQLLDTERVMKGTSDDLKQLSPVIKALGDEPEMIRRHQARAAEGDTILLACAPSDLDTQRLMNVARNVGYHTAHKYDRFTISKL